MNRRATIQLPSLRKPHTGLRTGPLVLGAELMLPIIVVTGILALSSSEPLLTIACIAVLIIGAKLIWRVGEPPILFAVFFIQWVQISLLILRSPFTDVNETLLYTVPGIVPATWLSLGGLLTLAGGIRIMLGRSLTTQAFDRFTAEIWQYSPQKAFKAYWVAMIVVQGVDQITWLYSGVSQVLIALAALKWAFFFVLAVIVLVQKRGYLMLTLVFTVELILGFLSFFSDFKQVFFILAIAALTARPKVNIRTVFAALPIFAAIIVLLACWSIVKIPYRNFLNEGTGRQTIMVGPVDRFEKVVDLMWNVGFPNLGEGFLRLGKRVEYTQYFGGAVDFVPAVVPHAGGEIWGSAIIHILTPRLLFSDKPPLEADIVNTAKYTGFDVTNSGHLTDTEIPMGYMAESYVDFGPIFMFVPIFLLGLLYGAEYRYLANFHRYRLFAYGAMPVVLQMASEYGTSAAKILGGNLTVFAATFIAFRLIVPLADRWIRTDRNMARV